MLVGNLVSILSSGVITVVWSFVSSILNKVDNMSPEDVWDKTRDIDNPLRPWSENYIRYESVFFVA